MHPFNCSYKKMIDLIMFGKDPGDQESNGLIMYAASLLYIRV